MSGLGSAILHLIYTGFYIAKSRVPSAQSLVSSFIHQAVFCDAGRSLVMTGDTFST